MGLSVSSGEAPVPEVRLCLSLGSEWEESECLSWLQQLVHHVPGPRALPATLGCQQLPLRLPTHSALLPVFVVSAQEPMGELSPNTALPRAKQHDAKLSICKYTFSYKPLGVRSIPWETVESV